MGWLGGVRVGGLGGSQRVTLEGQGGTLGIRSGLPGLSEWDPGGQSGALGGQSGGPGGSELGFWGSECGRGECMEFCSFLFLPTVTGEMSITQLWGYTKEFEGFIECD